MKSFFENDSKMSMGRLLSFVVTLCGVAVGLILAFTGKLDGNGVSLVLGMIGLAITGKVVTGIRGK